MKRKQRYRESKNEQGKVSANYPTDIKTSEFPDPLVLTGDEFRNLVDVFAILLNIDRRIKGEE